MCEAALSMARNPYDNSRPIDVHLKSGHKNVNGVIQEVAKEIQGYLGKGYKQHPAKYKRHIEVVILDLFVAWKTDVNLYVAYSRDEKKYKDSRYSKLHISYNPLLKVIDTLMCFEFIEGTKGFYNPQGQGRNSRMKAGTKLVNLFIAHSIRTQHIARISPEPLILRDEKTDHVIIDCRKVMLPGKELEIQETRAIKDMRARVNKVNKIQREHSVTFEPTREIYRQILTIKDRRGRQKYHLPNPLQDQYSRIFNVDMEHGGRWYGHWSQGLLRSWRPQIRINGDPVTELDFKALHPTMLYVSLGLPVPEGDMYSLEHPPRDVDLGESLRKVCKRIVLTILNAKPDQNEVAACVDVIWREDDIKLDHQSVRYLIEALKKKHAPIAEHFASGIGGELQRKDSSIAEKVMTTLADEGIVALCVHDSFIVARQYRSRLAEVMQSACSEVCGFVPIVDIKY